MATRTTALTATETSTLACLASTASSVRCGVPANPRPQGSICRTPRKRSGSVSGRPCWTPWCGFATQAESDSCSANQWITLCRCPVFRA